MRGSRKICQGEGGGLGVEGPENFLVSDQLISLRAGRTSLLRNNWTPRVQLFLEEGPYIIATCDFSEGSSMF